LSQNHAMQKFMEVRSGYTCYGSWIADCLGLVPFPFSLMKYWSLSLFYVLHIYGLQLQTVAVHTRMPAALVPSPLLPPPPPPGFCVSTSQTQYHG
jgi:hypothetical protein